MNQTVLITGGTGVVGKALSEALLKKGYAVIILTRNITGKKSFDKLNYAAWDVKKQTIDLDAVQKADIIIHLAGAGVVEKKWTEAYKKEIEESRTQSSSLLVDSLKNNVNKVKTVISSSAIGFYGDDKNKTSPFTENDLADKSFLGHTCKLWEESITPVTDLGKRLVILRTGIVLSNTGGAFAEFKKPMRFGVATILGNGRQMVSWIHIDDLCSMFITAIENTTFNGVYNAVAPNPVSNKKLMLCLAKQMKRHFYIPIHVPSIILKLMLGQRSIEVLKSATVSCKKILNAGFKFQYKSIDPAVENLITATSRH
ncbi:MAG: TIGR01777 family oxidoreductase [Ferruginibacter sp.]|nr:TIGR01777 family oxidoreductase [Bacteroidota bacterium]MBX2919982.1 TIGR01777 family oxidoreductase [Ferruginibacter sp.]MCB0708833.1 TIGR01777 family oxidoreductase [Chitinophagaceae bacterium]